MNTLYKDLRQFGNVKTDVPMSKYTTFKIGGNAKYVLMINDTDRLVAALTYLDGVDVPYFILGGGSNMLVRDEGFDGVVLQIKNRKSEIINDRVVADAGCNTVEIAQLSMSGGLAGFEWGVGVPGTIGGAVRGNAGAMGKEMQDDIYSVDVYSNGEVVTYTNKQCQFGYRHSRFKEHNEIILRVRLGLKPYEDKDEQVASKKKMLDFLKYRNETQPKGFASTGCIFKNADVANQKSKIRNQKSLGEKNHDLLIEHFGEEDEKVLQFLNVGKISAGWLVEQAGMKGAKVGGAEVSAVHGNFIINNGSATASDVLTLIEEIKQKVYTSSGILLEEEIQIL